ncbi:MAG: V-type ATP synthase subunit I [Candidatus Methanofastidiosia archaeon]
MLKPKKMSKVLIVGTKDVLEKTINTLYELKVIHIIDYRGQEKGFEIGNPMKKSSIFSEYILSLRALKGILNLSSETTDKELKDFEFSQEFRERLAKLENDVVVKRKKIEDIEMLLSDIEKIDNKDEIVKLDLSDDVKNIMANLIESKDKLKKEKEVLEKELKSINEEYKNFILTAEEFLSREIEKAETPLRLATTENTFLIEGWIPKEKVPNTQNVIKENTDEKAHVLEIEGIDEDTPTYVKTPKPFKPFEALVDMFSTPRYDEISPTILISFTFPLFYGIMLGDLGYGISLFILSMILKQKMKSPGWQSLLNMMTYASYFTMIFGVLYGEIFGFELYHLFGIKKIGNISLPLAHRLEKIVPLLVTSVAIGVVHLTGGYIIGFINVYRNKGLKEAILEKASWVGILFTLISFFLVEGMLYPKISLLVFFIMLMYMGEGLQGLIEIFSLISNLISYTRLLAIGLSSVGIALAINKIVFDVIVPKGSVFIVFGILTLIIGHTLNLALGIIASFLHSLRLQYVEFFTKFYKGGGIKFIPLGIREQEV